MARVIMGKSIIAFTLAGLILAGCSSVEYYKSDHCLTYSISDYDIPWHPIKFYQDESALYIELPATVKFEPKLQIIDTEFSQRLSIPYTYNPATHIYRVEDNYDEYVLTRRDTQEFYENTVKIKCNRVIPAINDD